MKTFNFNKNQEKANGVHELNEKIGKLLAEAEQAGMKGEVGKSQEVFFHYGQKIFQTEKSR